MKKYSKKKTISFRNIKNYNSIKSKRRIYKNLQDSWKENLLKLNKDKLLEQFFVNCVKDNRKIVKLLIENSKVDINSIDEFGDNALILCAQYSSYDTMRYLVSNAVNINFISHRELSALHILSAKGNVKQVEYLIKNGANPNIVGHFEETPIFEAVNKNNFKTTQKLIELGANVNMQNEKGRTPLFTACQNSRRIESLICLINNGADINHEDENKMRALSFAIKNNNYKAFNILLSVKAEINFKDKFGTTPLMLACKIGNLEMVKNLVKQGADINKVDIKGHSALDYAKNNHFKLCQEFLNKSFKISQNLEQNQ